MNLVIDFGYNLALAEPNKNKFKQIWLAEIEAKLVLETHAGQAWVTLHVCLGEHSGHHQQPPHCQELAHIHTSTAEEKRDARCCKSGCRETLSVFFLTLQKIQRKVQRC